MDNCLFCKIAKGEIDAETVYSDEHLFAIKDINPQAPTHLLIIPKKHLGTSTTAPQSTPLAEKQPV